MHDAEIAALRAQFTSLQTSLGGRAALFSKRDAETQTITDAQQQIPAVYGLHQ